MYDDDGGGGGGGSARACGRLWWWRKKSSKKIFVKNHNFKKADHPQLFLKDRENPESRFLKKKKVNTHTSTSAALEHSLSGF